MAQKKNVKPVPPNLKVDPRSSFAPHVIEEDRMDAPPPKEQKEEDDEEGQDEQLATTAAEEEEEDLDVFVDDDDEEEEDEERWFASPPRAKVLPLPDRLHISVYDFGEPSNHRTAEPEQVGTLYLNESVFGLDPSTLR